MPLTKSELLIPRVLCIGGKEGEPNFPGSLYKSGEILTISKSGFSYTNSKDDYIRCDHVERHPHLFKPLPWWEKREESEWPEYVLFTSDYMRFNKGDVYKWESWGKENYNRCQFRRDKSIYGLVAVPFGHWVAPADLSDYQEYQKQKEA